MKNISINIILLFTAISSCGQKDIGYVKGGLSLFIGGAKTSDDLTVLPAITIAPGLRIIKAKEFSISTDFPVSIGASDKNNDFHFGIDAPATINFNFGFGSSRKSTAKFGFSLGAGVGYHYSYNEFYDPFYNEEYDELSVAGYVFQTGLFFRGKNASSGSGGGIRFSYLANSNSKPVKKKVLGISLLAII